MIDISTEEVACHFWAKTRKGTAETHALLYHLVDSGQVALALWEEAFTPSLRGGLAEALALPEGDAGRILAFWVALHDVGKASPAFQYKHPPAAERLRRAGLPFQPPGDFTPEPHGLVSTWVLAEVLPAFGLSKGQAAAVARALGGHHGVMPTLSATLSPHRKANLGSQAWDEARRRLITLVSQAFAPPQPPSFPDEEAAQNAFLSLFAGLASVADWVASMAEHFWCADPGVPLPEYVARSRRQARAALRELGWVGWQPEGRAASFTQSFPFAPSAIQQVAIDRAQCLTPPALAILEAPTGSGKTETALYLAERWLQQHGGRGLYVAMPTQATSNQMFDRVVGFLKKQYPAQLVNVQLVHGQALLSDALADLSLATVDEDGGGRVAALGWFQPRKRSLLAPFGVGTVDQAFLAALQTRHFFVRLFGLGHKVVIFDEVHAYDVYMNEIFLRLLAWLRAIGTSVIVLSATLPAQTRRVLVRAYGGCLPDGQESGFPCLTVVTGKEAACLPLPPTPDRRLNLRRLEASPEAIVAYLRERLAAGGCAAVICNTVSRAQAVYRAVREAELVDRGNCLLFHARFPFAWRQKTEEEVLDRFGKKRERREPAIVVATQVIEQSLDLDFDHMVSDLCPVDLLIQRAGRLWRHERSQRPASEPELALAEPPRTDAGEPQLGGDALVYEPYYLLRTIACLEGREHLDLPSESAALVEAVYGETSEAGGEGPLAALIAAAKAKMERERRASVANARSRLVLPPEDEDFLAGENAALEEDAPQVHEALRALTREASEGVTLICLHRLPGGGLGDDPERTGALLDLAEPPTAEGAKRLLDLGVQVQRQDLVRYFAAQPPPAAWREHPTLRHCRPAVFENGVCRPEGLPCTLVLDRELGLRVTKEV